ncbi:MAG: TlpA family protein disulfide reductase [Acidobacteria bacterium]|nr:TlpA family protein disulfide reductase [Acidobacteriota bacterium]
MNRLTGFITVAILAALAVGSAACGIGTAKTENAPDRVSVVRTERGTAVGQLAPEFELAKTDGTKISLKELEGSPAMIVFWTAWCPVCKEEAPHVNEIFEEFGPKGLNVVGINIGESEARVQEGIKDFGIKYTVAKDTTTSVAKSYKVVGTPTVVILDKKGTVKYFGNEIPKNSGELIASLLL